MDEIFQEVHGFKGAFDVVKVSLEKPRRFGKNGELLIDYQDTERARSMAERRRSSTAGQGTDQFKYEGGNAQQYEEKSDSSH